MATESVCELFDEVAEYVASCRPRQPPWCIQTDSVGRLYVVTVTIDGVDVLDVSARDLGEAHRKALVAWRAWESQTEPYLVEALTTSIEAAQAERAAGVPR